MCLFSHTMTTFLLLVITVYAYACPCKWTNWLKAFCYQEMKCSPAFIWRPGNLSEYLLLFCETSLLVGGGNGNGDSFLTGKNSFQRPVCRVHAIMWSAHYIPVELPKMFCPVCFFLVLCRIPKYKTREERVLQKIIPEADSARWSMLIHNHMISVWVVL